MLHQIRPVVELAGADSMDVSLTEQVQQFRFNQFALEWILVPGENHLGQAIKAFSRKPSRVCAADQIQRLVLLGGECQMFDPIVRYQGDL